jgi:hypothetical protein
MPTNAELQNASEFLPDNSPMLSSRLTNNINGISASTPYTPLNTNVAGFAPNGFNFDAQGMSNGYNTRISGITDFREYNNYIHNSQIQGATVQFNVYDNLSLATQAFRIYSRQYRGTIR